MSSTPPSYEATFKRCNAECSCVGQCAKASPSSTPSGSSPFERCSNCTCTNICAKKQSASYGTFTRCSDCTCVDKCAKAASTSSTAFKRCSDCACVDKCAKAALPLPRPNKSSNKPLWSTTTPAELEAGKRNTSNGGSEKTPATIACTREDCCQILKQEAEGSGKGIDPDLIRDVIIGLSDGLTVSLLRSFQSLSAMTDVHFLSSPAGPIRAHRWTLWHQLLAPRRDRRPCRARLGRHLDGRRRLPLGAGRGGPLQVPDGDDAQAPHSNMQLASRAGGVRHPRAVRRAARRGGPRGQGAAARRTGPARPRRGRATATRYNARRYAPIPRARSSSSTRHALGPRPCARAATGQQREDRCASARGSFGLPAARRRRRRAGRQGADVHLGARYRHLLLPR